MSHHVAPARLISMGKSLVVVGAGFAGVRAALAAAEVIGQAGEDQTEITVVSPDPVMGIRPRFYEAELDGVRQRSGCQGVQALQRLAASVRQRHRAQCRL